MLDASTISLILTLTGFVLVAIVVVHHHNCSDEIRRRRLEVKHITHELTSKGNAYERQIQELRRQIEDVELQIQMIQRQVDK